MKIECGDIISIPEGCKAIVKGGIVVFEKVQKFKDGDVLCSANGTMLIFKEEEEDDSNYFYSHYNTDCSGINGCLNKAAFRHATEEEKQLLFDKMKEQGLRWNAEEKRVEKIRWRAKENEDYYFVDMDLTVKSLDDTYSTFDNKLWDNFNYFRTKEQAEEAAKRVKEVLRKFHEEIGE